MTSEPWMKELQEGYLRSLPGKLEEIRSLAHRLREVPADGDAIHALAHALARLVGSAGSYGFPAVSSLLSPSARLLSQADEGRLALTGPDLAYLLDLLDEVEEMNPAPH
jgi:chemotaxis protein histidine kinase CheA